MNIYLDTSAYLCLLLREKSWQHLSKILHGARYFSSVLLFLETQRNLVRLSRDHLLSETEYEKLVRRLRVDVNLFVLKDMDLDLCLSGKFPAVSLPKSLDLIHLRTALWFRKQEESLKFITLDQSQQRAAEELGLEIIFLSVES